MKIINTKNNIPINLDGKVKICLHISCASDASIILPRQSHRNNVIELIKGDEFLNDIDGLFTKNKSFEIGVTTRDCAPVCLFDDDKIGVVHIGWRGLVNGIYGNISQYFNEKNITVYVAPFLNQFEIKRDFCFDNIRAKFGEEFFEFKDDKIIFNFKNALSSILPINTIWDSRNTYDDLSLPSNRRGDKNNFVTSICFEK